MPAHLLSMTESAALAAAWTVYGVVHSALAANPVKAAIMRRWPTLQRTYRAAFNALAVLLLIPPLALTHALAGPPLWRWSGPLEWLSHAIAAIAMGTFLWTCRHYDMREFLGTAAWQEGGTLPPPLRLSPLHRFVRHPWYFLALLLIWTRDMDAARLIAAIIITAYFWIGSGFEERKLIETYGESYRRYRARVGGLMPLPGRWLTRAEAASIMGTPQNRGDTPFPPAGGGV